MSELLRYKLAANQKQCEAQRREPEVTINERTDSNDRRQAPAHKVNRELTKMLDQEDETGGRDEDEELLLGVMRTIGSTMSPPEGHHMLVLCGFISTTSEMVWTRLEEGQWILVEGRSGWKS